MNEKQKELWEMCRSYAKEIEGQTLTLKVIKVIKNQTKKKRKIGSRQVMTLLQKKHFQ